jgi:hypothetical protein
MCRAPAPDILRWNKGAGGMASPAAGLEARFLGARASRAVFGVSPNTFPSGARDGIPRILASRTLRGGCGRAPAPAKTSKIQAGSTGLNQIQVDSTKKAKKVMRPIQKRQILPVRLSQTGSNSDNNENLLRART